MEPIERLLAIADETAGPETLRWFKGRLTVYLADRNRPSMEKVLGIASPGQGKPSERTRYAKALRDDYLQKAFALIDPAGKPTARVDELQKEVRAFESRIWPRWEGLDEPPSGCSELRRLIFLAMKTGEPIPAGWRSLYRIVYGY